MKASQQFKTIIENYLSETALKDFAFAQNLAKASKSIDSCINYIGGEVKKTGLCAFADQEIFDMAVKYYNDDSIPAPAQANFRAVVNQPLGADLFTPAPLSATQSTEQKTPVTQTAKPQQTTLTLFDL